MLSKELDYLIWMINWLLKASEHKSIYQYLNIKRIYSIIIIIIILNLSKCSSNPDPHQHLTPRRKFLVNGQTDFSEVTVCLSCRNIPHMFDSASQKTAQRNSLFYHSAYWETIPTAQTVRQLHGFQIIQYSFCFKSRL